MRGREEERGPKGRFERRRIYRSNLNISFRGLCGGSSERESGRHASRKTFVWVGSVGTLSFLLRGHQMSNLNWNFNPT